MRNDITRDRFRQACGYWATGVSIITTSDADGKPYGLTMNGITSLSLEPPLFAICVDNGSNTLRALKRNGGFCINVLREEQQDLAEVFAARGTEKFNGVAYDAGATGAPRLHDTLMTLECRVSDIASGGDHQIVIGEVRDIWINDDDNAAPLLFYRGRYSKFCPDLT
jgi:flavin reductase (DIM6/NTAB) family NADH-FMN oxidoreductase RutF